MIRVNSKKREGSKFNIFKELKLFGFIFVLIIGFLFRIIIIFNSRVTFFSDDAIYASLARFWVEGDWEHVFHPFWQPMFPFLSALVFHFIPQWEVSLRLVSALAGIILLAPVFFLARKTLSYLHAIQIIFVLSLFYPIIFSSVIPLSDSLSAGLIVSFLVVISFAIHSKNLPMFAIGGMLVGLAYLTRSEGLMFFSLTAFYLLFWLVIKSLSSRKISFSRFLILSVFIIAFFLTVSPYALIIKNQLGVWTLSQKFSAQVQQSHAFVLRENGTTWAQEINSVRAPNFKSYYFHNGTEYVLDHIDYLSIWFFQKLTGWIDNFLNIFPAWSILFIILGVITSLSKGYFGGFSFLVFVLLVSIPITIFVTPITDLRYLLWVIPFLFYFFYLGADLLLRIFGRILLQSKLPRLQSLLTLALFAISLSFPAISWSIITHPISVLAKDLTSKYERVYMVEAADWVNRNSEREHPRIMMRHEIIEFYTDGETVYTPQVSYKDFLDYARKYNVDFIVAWAGELAMDFQLSILLDNTIQKPGLREEYTADTPDGKLIIYSLERI